MICEEHGSLKRNCLHCEMRELYAELHAMEAENRRLRAEIMDIFQAARNDCSRWDGGQCVGMPRFADRTYARRLVRYLQPILYPEVTVDAARKEAEG